MKTRSISPTLVPVVLCVMLCSSSRAVTNYVSTADGIFTPEQLAINAGDTVTWLNEDTTEHNITSDNNIFVSDTLIIGDSYSYTFTEPGFYPYFCVFHGAPGGVGMAGSIVVSGSGENTPPDEPFNESPANNATNQPVAVELRGSGFSDPDGLDFHGASQWVLRYASNGLVVHDSGEVSGSGNLTNYNPAGLAEGTAYDWQVRYKDGRGAWSEFSTSTRFTTLVEFVGDGVGLKASYNNIADFSSPLAVVTNGTVNFNWGATRPHRRITSDAFAVRWEGSLLPEFTEQYQIHFQFQGGARVWINNQLLIDEWSACLFTQTPRASAPLVAGQLVAVRVEYAATAAGAQAILRWSSPSLPVEVVPAVRLFPHAP